MISEEVTTKISKSTFSHPCSKFLATAKVGLAHYDSFRGGGSYIRCTLFVSQNSRMAASPTLSLRVSGQGSTCGTGHWLSEGVSNPSRHYMVAHGLFHKIP